jgi:hypothetical protein
LSKVTRTVSLGQFFLYPTREQSSQPRGLLVVKTMRRFSDRKGATVDETLFDYYLAQVVLRCLLSRRLAALSRPRNMEVPTLPSAFGLGSYNLKSRTLKISRKDPKTRRKTPGIYGDR